MEIIFSGFGGQGVLTSGLITAYMAMKNDYEVMWSPGYGVEQRGGKAHSLVKYDREPILEPIVTELDALVAMSQPALDYCEKLKKGGLVIVNSDVVDRSTPIPAHAKVIWLPVNTVAQKAGNAKGANIVPIGVLVRETGMFTLEAAERALCAFFEEKGKGAFNEKNIAAFEAGYFYEEKEAL